MSREMRKQYSESHYNPKTGLFEGGESYITYDSETRPSTSYEHIEMNTPVVVWDDAQSPVVIQHFSHVGNDGKPRTFIEGRTSFTEIETQSWDKCVPLSTWEGEKPFNSYTP